MPIYRRVTLVASTANQRSDDFNLFGHLRCFPFGWQCPY